VHNVEGVHIRDGGAQLVDVLQGPVPAPKIRDNGVEEVSAADVFLWCTCQRQESGRLLNRRTQMYRYARDKWIEIHDQSQNTMAPHIYI
jgi:hypothetical protein